MTNANDRPARLAIVIGAMRCGTTTLFQLLQQAPSVSLTRIKEPDYFIAGKSLYRGPGWYASLFAHPERLCMDISPNYAKNDVFPGVAEEIKRFDPAARIIYIVREPIKRAVSEYHHQKAAGVDMPPTAALLDSPEGAHIVSTSSYGKQLADYYAAFGADQILVVDMDDFVRDPQTVTQSMMTFCGDATPLPDLRMSVENDRGSVERLPKFWLALRRTRLGDRIRDLVPSSLHKSLKSLGSKVLGRKPPGEAAAEFEPEVLDRMRALLKDDMARFRALTGRDFSHWSV